LGLPIAELKGQVAVETSLISSLILKMETIGKQLGVTGDYERLIAEAGSRRAKAQAELERLLVGSGKADGGEFELNYDRLMDAKHLLGAFSKIAQPSPLIEAAISGPVRELLTTFETKLILYPSLDGSNKGSAAISFDLGTLGYDNEVVSGMSHLIGGGPRGFPKLGATGTCG
jgi:hypothetical protein